jgi:hypothetical protein
MEKYKVMYYSENQQALYTVESENIKEVVSNVLKECKGRIDKLRVTLIEDTKKR